LQKLTKDAIKKEGLKLFAYRGYDGTTMNDIAKKVGITAPALYAHFKGKEELFCSIYEDLVKEYVGFMDKLINTAKTMDIEAGLYYIFEQYIIDTLRRPETRSFWTQATLSTPPELRGKFYNHVSKYTIQIRERIETIFAEGIRQGILREDDPVKMSWSHQMMRDGFVTWMLTSPEPNKDKYIKAFWNDLWFGLKKSS